MSLAPKYVVLVHQKCGQKPAFFCTGLHGTDGSTLTCTCLRSCQSIMLETEHISMEEELSGELCPMRFGSHLGNCRVWFSAG